MTAVTDLTFPVLIDREHDFYLMGESDGRGGFVFDVPLSTPAFVMRAAECYGPVEGRDTRIVFDVNGTVMGGTTLTVTDIRRITA